MKMFTFTGENPAEALKKAQAECGEDALVVSTKEIRKKSLGQSALYEVVVALEDAPAPKAAPRANAAAPRKEAPMEDDVLFSLSETARQISEIAKVAELPTRSLPRQNAAPSIASTAAPKPAAASPLAAPREQVEIKEIQKEIGKLADRVKLIQNMVWDKTVDTRSGLVIPSEFAEIYRVSRQSGMAADHLDALMRLTVEHMPLNMRQSSETVRRYFNVLLRKMVPVRVESRLTRPNKKVMMLVGPTGVGKTTTLAKLAARYAYQLPEKYKVGIMTLDTYRIGAVEQLMYYAKMMRLGIETVQDPLDFSSALQSLKHCDYVLIDTAGCSQHDREKIARIGQFLDAEKQTSIDVSLVLSSNTKLEDLRDIYKNYATLGIDTIIATKLDETAGLGSLFSFIYENKKPLSYLSVGQEVPDDLVVADADYFISCLLDGFRREREVS
ncbi:MAG: flagellar biosynthesis protein FlhF [Campylobacterales bacterium]